MVSGIALGGGEGGELAGGDWRNNAGGSTARGGEVVVVVAGATGTGKSRLGVELALALGGEVLNADALQVYQGLAVTTNQLSVAEQQGAPSVCRVHFIPPQGVDTSE
jgi:adenylate isopentenyltransferase (cytokinin synthase)